MTKSTITRERLEQLADNNTICKVSWDERIELAQIALSAMDGEPVAWAWHYREQWHVTNDERRAEFVAKDGDVAVLPLYRHAQPVPERDQVRIAHAEWSQATFGNVGPVGPLKHLSKEALEAAVEPGDLSEWADMQFLLWDAQRRAGVTDEQITQAMIEKLAVNKQRSWPEPKDGEPRLHIKAQPAPVVPDAATAIRACLSEFPESARDIVEECADIAENACRAAMLAAAPQSPGSEPATVPGKWIPVSERMPEVGVKVLCFPAEDEPIHAVFNGQLWLQDISWSNSDEPIDNVITCNVTHWVPLPASPQEVK